MNNNYTKKNFNTFWKNGFLVIKNFVAKEFCDYTNLLARQFANKDFAQIMHLHREEYLVAQSSEKLNKLSSLHEKILFYRKIRSTSDHFNQFLKMPEIVDYLEWLYEKKMTGLLTNIFFKEPGTKYAKQSWQPHQDNSYLDNKGGMYITVNVPLNSMNKKNGGLKLYPGSHKLGLLESSNVISYREKDGKPGKKILNKIDIKPVQLNLKKGDILFMHGLCVHESSDNLSNTARPLISLGYIPYGEKFKPGFNSKRTVTFLN